jgi:TolB protein
MLRPLLCLVAVTLAIPAAAQDPIIGNIEGAEFRPYPIAVPKFRGEGEGAKLGDRLAEVIRDDLDLSGVFKVLDPKSFIDTDGVTKDAVKFQDWLNVGADGLVKAQVKRAGKSWSVEVHAYEVARKVQGFTKTYTLDGDKERRLAHAIADDLYEHYTGEPGIFQTKIAVVRKTGGSKHLFVLDFDGENAYQVTRSGSLNLLPAWSPTGGSLVFTSYRYDNPDLFEINLGTRQVSRLSNRPGLNTGGRVSPDNSKIALTLSRDGNSEVYVLDRRGGLHKRLTKSWGIDTSPAWAPDGKKLAFVSSRARHPHIYVMNADGSNQRRLTFEGTYNQTPSFSPRGDIIAFTGRDEYNRFDIFLFYVKTGEIKRVTQGQGNNEDPSFSPNGRLLTFTSTRKGGRQIWISNLEGTHQRQITRGGQHSTPAWGPFRK